MNMHSANDVMAVEMADMEKPWAGLSRRIATALAFAFVVLLAGYAGGLFFTALIMLAAMQMYREFCRMTEGIALPWKYLGVTYIALPCISLIWLRGLQLPLDPDAGLYVVLFLITLVAVTDIGAFFSGRTIGGAKLAPSISPNKTWAGLLGGMLAASIAAVLFKPLLAIPVPNILLALTGALTALVAQMGDLSESWLKRRAGVKDSGTLLPGHGGLLDRVDGFMFTAPLLAFILCLSGLAS